MFRKFITKVTKDAGTGLLVIGVLALVLSALAAALLGVFVVVGFLAQLLPINFHSLHDPKNLLSGYLCTGYLICGLGVLLWLVIYELGSYLIKTWKSISLQD